ncbi:GTPase activating protein [Entamoeba marina]
MGNDIHKISNDNTNPRQSVQLSDTLHVNKDVLFLNEKLEVNKKYKDEVIVTNLQSFKIDFRLEQIFGKDYQLKFSPQKGSIPPKGKKKIISKLALRQKINANIKVGLYAETHGQLFLNVKLRSDSGVFGVDPDTLDWVMHPTRNVLLPQVIITLDIAFREKGGYLSEGVFRLAGEQSLVKSLKTKLNETSGTLAEGMDATVDEISNLIKLWFRELPNTILNVLNSDHIFYAAEPEASWNAYLTLPDSSRVLLDWLFDLLIEVASHKDVNKMTLQNLAIVLSPNLYEPQSTDPMEGLMMSQKSVQFVENCLMYKTGNTEQ